MSKDNKSEMTQAIDDGTVELSNGVLVVNTSPHPFVFDDGTVVPPCGISLNAQFVETEVTFMEWDNIEITFVVTQKLPTEQGLEFVSAVPAQVIILGSMIAAEAYGFPVVQPIPTPETAGRGTPPADKRIQSSRFGITQTRNSGL